MYNSGATLQSIANTLNNEGYRTYSGNTFKRNTIADILKNDKYTVFAALSKLEREQLKQRQREDIEIAKAQGKYTGRKLRKMGITANTFYRRVRKYEATHGITEQVIA